MIRDWHKERGWSDVGYHFYITFDGFCQSGRALEKIPAAQQGHNLGTIAICLGGLDENDFTIEQFNTLKKLCTQIDNEIPDVTFHGHCEVSNKSCPVFDYKTVLGLDEFGKMKIGAGRLTSSKAGVIDRFETAREALHEAAMRDDLRAGNLCDVIQHRLERLEYEVFGETLYEDYGELTDDDEGNNDNNNTADDFHRNLPA